MTLHIVPPDSSRPLLVANREIVPSSYGSYRDADFIGVCMDCHRSPCEWTQFGPSINAKFESLFRWEIMNEKVVLVNLNDNKLVSHEYVKLVLYRQYVRNKHGRIRHGNTYYISICLGNMILEMCPFYKANESGDDRL